jgi:Hsp20/alpha crystallin family
LQVHQADGRLVLAAPMPGLEAEDISVIISGNRVTLRGEYRGSRQNQPEILISEWTMGPYYREVVLPQPVDGALTNATYGNGVLVLSMPICNRESRRAIQSSGSRPTKVHEGSALAIQVQTYSQPPPGSITNESIRPPSKWSESSLLPLLLSPEL